VKSHAIYVLVDADGKFVDAFLSYSEAVREQYRGARIITVRGREDY
jgi:hypothetical protein